MFKIIILFFFALNLFAETSWEENIPTAKNFDWIQTTSGEWLKGEILGMYNDELSFDSDEFGEQNIDWDDVKRLISKSTTSLNIEGRGTITGQLYVHDGYIFLSSEQETLKLERNQIVSMTNGEDIESSYWSGDFSLGISLSGGNTEKKEITSKLRIKRQTSLTRFLIDNLGNYTENFGLETENNQRLTSSFDIFQTRSFFWRPAFLEYSRDLFQNIENKYTIGLGAGYDIISSSKMNWTVFAGPAYQSLEFDTVAKGDENPVNTAAFLFTTDYDLEIRKNIDFIFKYQGYLVSERSGKYVHHIIATLKTELISDFDLDYSVIWDRVENPIKDADGNIPEQDDYKTVLSLAYSF